MPTNPQSELAAILHGAALAPITDRAFLRITGPDATRWLNGMVTNSIQSLAPGEGNYNFLLNAQGRIQGDCTIYREPGEERTFVLESTASQIATIHELLDRFIIMDDVEIASGLQILGHAVVGITVLGPRAPALLSKVLSAIEDDEDALPLTARAGASMGYANAPPQHRHWNPVQANEDLLLVLTPAVSAVPRFDLWNQTEAGSKRLNDLLTSAGAVQVSLQTLEAFRLLSGTPRYGTDIRNTETARDLPQETAQTHALHFTKGCYLGQEIVERIHSRGQVHRTFTRFRLTPTDPQIDPGTGPAAALPILPTILQADGKPAGELTSAAWVPLPEGPELLALGYIRREALELRKPLSYSGGTAVALPKPEGIAAAQPASELLASATIDPRP